MLSILGRGVRLCDGMTRREVMQIGGSGVAGLSLADVLRAKGTPYTPSNIMANLYRHLGIDPAKTIPDHRQRPMYLLDDREPVRELI